MNYLRSGIKSIVGQNGSSIHGSAEGAETVDRLVERLQTATMPEDRRDAIRALKSLSKRFRLEVGTQAMDALLDILRSPESSTEILSYGLETMSNVIGGDPEEEETEYSEAEAQDLGERFTEIFIKKRDNINLVVSFIENYEFTVRLHAVRLLTSLLRHRPKDIQEHLLLTPGAIPKITDLLSESREVVRNDTVLLIYELVRGNSNIQKIVAFESAFERLLDIVYQEHDSIVAEDALYVTMQLLKNNSSNQQLFRENSLIPRLPLLLRLLSGNTAGIMDDDQHDDSRNQTEVQWTAQRVSNIHLLFQVIRALISPSTSAGNLTVAGQKSMNACGLLGELCQVLFSGGVPADVLTESINTVAEICRGYQPNQDYFGGLVAPSDPPRPAVLVLIMSMANDKQPFTMRTAALYCVECYLYKNEKAKRDIIGTLLPSSSEGPDITAGHLICSGLVSSDPLVVWCSCCILLHCVLDSPQVEKERLLRVQMATAAGNAPVSLLQQVATILTQARDLQVRLAVLMLLSGWLNNCPAAVAQFLQYPAAVPYLTNQASMTEGDEYEALAYGMCAFVLGLCLLYNDDSLEKYNRRALQQILQNRVTCGVFVDQLASVSKSEPYARAAQKPQPKSKQPSELLFDHEFTKLFRHTESELSRIMDGSGHYRIGNEGGSRRSKGSATARDSESTSDTNRRVDHSQLNGDLLSALPPQTAEQHQSVVQQYKELIKRQDAEITSLKQRVKEFEAKAIATTASTAESQRKDQEFENALADLQQQLAEKCKLIEEKEESVKQLKEKADETPTIHQMTDTVERQQLEIQRLTGDTARLSAELGQTKVVCNEQETELASLRQHCAQWRAYYESQITPDSHQVVSGLEAQLKDLESQLAYGWKAYEGQSEQLATLTAEHEQAKQQLDYHQQWSQYWKYEYERLASRPVEAPEKSTAPDDNEKSSLLDELALLRKEQEDLLVLCADQDQKLKEYKKILKEHGLLRAGQVSDDDEGEDDDDDEEEMEAGRGHAGSNESGNGHQQEEITMSTYHHHPEINLTAQPYPPVGGVVIGTRTRGDGEDYYDLR